MGGSNPKYPIELNEEHTLKKSFWIFMMSATIALWVCLSITGFMLFPLNHWALFVFPGILLFFHALELSIAFHIGRDMYIPHNKVMLYTLIFGFTWWVPLKQRVWKAAQKPPVNALKS